MEIIGIDVESTSVEPGARIVEVGAVAVSLDSVEVLIESDIDPGIPVTHMDGATSLNGFTQARANRAPPSAETLAAFIRAVSARVHTGAVVCTHNAAFDCGLLAYELEAHELPVPGWPVVCTLSLARTLGTTPNNRLETIAEAYGLSWQGEAHRALGDAWKSAAYLQRIQSSWPAPWPAPMGTANTFGEWVKQWDGAYTQDFPPGFECLPERCRLGQGLEFTYATPRGKKGVEEKRRTIIPQGLAIRGGNLHFHGFCLLANDNRAFRADRVVAIHN